MKRILFLLLINLIPVAFILFNVNDLLNVFFGKEDYPFGSEFFSPYSIYKSRGLFIAYNLVEIVALSCLILCSIIRKWRLYLILLYVCLMMVFYRMFAI